MFKGQVTFQTVFAGMAFETIEVIPPCPNVLKATIESSFDKGILLEVEIADAGTFDAAIKQAQEVAQHITKVLTFKFSVFHQPFRLVKDSLIEEQLSSDGSTKLIHHLQGGMRVGGSTSEWTNLGSKQVIELRNSLQKKLHSGFFYYDLFYFALGLSDPIAKFMALYSIVLSLCSDKQEKVDQFILSQRPSVRTNPPHKSRKSGVQETIYTRLRNQVGHVRPGTTLQTTRSEIEENLSDFMEITKELINQQP